MKDIIQQFIKENPKHAVKMIFNRPDMKEWVMNTCDSNCIDNATRLYTALTSEPILCPCNSGKLRKLITFNKGLSFCGPAGKCSAAKEAVSKKCIAAAANWDKETARIKRAATNKEKYGVENIGQSSKAKETRAKLYKNKEEVANITQKTKNTVIEKYGVSHVSFVSDIMNKKKNTMMERYGSVYPSQNKKIQEKTKLTNRERYGCDYPSQVKDIAAQISATKKNTMMSRYGRSHETQLHISESSWAILHDTDQFANMLISLGRTKMAEKLGVSVNLISVQHARFNLDILKSGCSAAEIEIRNFVESLGVEHTKNNVVCNGKELDIYIPSKKLAIEYNGLYWHSEKMGKDKNYHHDKTMLCNKQGIQLLHIFEDEWTNSPSVCRSIISSHLGIYQNKIPARKCKIVEPSFTELKSFLIDNHLQGVCSSSIRIALEYEGNIIMAMTFGNSRYNKNIQYELLRLASACDTFIIGGAQKIWSYFMKTYQPKSIVSYCDRRWFTGKIYETLGFTLVGVGNPGYWYTDYTNRFHRQNFTKKKAVIMATALLEGKDSIELGAMTEKEIVRDILGLDRVWDCGQDTWIWKK